jgi:uncharacterized protein (PEP-CTERM system associated)
VFPSLSPAPAPANGSEAAAAGEPGSPSPNPSAAPPLVAPPPLIPGYGYGSPLAPAAPPLGPPEPVEPPSDVRLRPLTPGAAPIQAGDLRAPPILVNSSIGLSEGYTDNPRNTPQTLSDSVTRLNSATNISVDSARFQGQLSSSTNYDKYARADDQTALNENLLGYGLTTLVRDHLFIDSRASISQIATNGGLGFANSTVLPPSQQTQALTTSLSPIWRESFGDLVDGELRYNFGLNLFNNGSLLSGSATPPTTAPGTATNPATLSNAVQNQATLSLATGRAIDLIGSKLTLDFLQVDTQSAAKSKQVRAYDDLEYDINSQYAVLVRAGYENLRYPLQPEATTSGPIWRFGGRLLFAPGDYLTLNYGRQDGIYGFNGAFRYQLTARTNLLASIQNGLSSSQEQILNSLNTSALDSNGTVVNQDSGLPSALTNPEFSYSSNSIFRTESARIGLQTTLDRDTFGLLGTADHRSAVGTPIAGTIADAATTGTDTSLGVNLNWSRSLTPQLVGTATLGYAREIASQSKTLTADLNLTYTMSERMTLILHYQFINTDSSMVGISTTGSFRRNLIEIGAKRSF